MVVEQQRSPAIAGTAFAPLGASGRPKFRFGVLQFFSWPNRRVPLQTVYAQALDRIEQMDRSEAYDAVWLAEHHFNTYSVCPSVHMIGMHVAARTQKLRLGTAVALAPMYHPLRMAEEVALLDVISGGRVNFGAGRGNDPVEFGVFGLDRDSSYAKFREHVDAVLQAWTNERLTYDGEFVHVKNVEVLPKPLQQPHPPTWLAATTPEAIAWSAEQGFSILMDPHSTHVDIARKYAGYKEGLAKAGHPVDGRVIPIARLMAVAPTDAEAEDVALRGAQWSVGTYVGAAARRALEGLPPLTGEAAEAERVEAEKRVQRYVDEIVIHGSPKRVVDEILRLREEIGMDYLMCSPLSYQTFQLVTNEVIPALARAIPTASAGEPYGAP